jgi:Rieske 2Fe-2S family protein
MSVTLKKGNQLTRTEQTFSSHYYYDPAHYENELKAVWYKNWIYACRADTLEKPRSFITIEIGSQNVLIMRDDDGEIKAFHNVCRHRGARLVSETEGVLKSKLIVCPYHAWCYKQDGSLKATSSKKPPENFKYENNSLKGVALTIWHGFVFVNLAGDRAEPFEEAIQEGSADFKNWQIETLKIGQTFKKVMDCNWKIFWENFNECLHCPGVHKSLVKIVPIYKRAMMEIKDDPNWQDNLDSDNPKQAGGMRKGAQTWTVDGQPIAQAFPNLTAQEIKNGHNYSTILPTVFIVAHVDYVRIVRLKPLGPEQTEIYVEWLFSEDILKNPECDISPAVDFSTTVLMEDAVLAELNQKGVRSIAYDKGTLMPEEYLVFDFRNWVFDQLYKS